jgi:hypothetical protein
MATIDGVNLGAKNAIAVCNGSLYKTGKSL